MTQAKEAKPYDYFAAPDGDEVLDKALHVLKPATLIGLGLSVIDTLCYSYPKGYLATFGRYLYVTTPPVAAATTFVCVSNLAGSIRKKDDEYNWLVGGIAAGSILGAYFKNYRIGFISGTAFGLAAMGLKVAHQCNFKIYEKKVTLAEGGVTSHKFDWTLTKERPRNWTTGTD